MKVTIKFLEVEGVREAFGENSFTWDLEGQSVGNLLREIMEAYGPKTERIFFTKGRYEKNLQIIVNWRTYVDPDRMDAFMLREGDTILFAPLLDGG